MEALAQSIRAKLGWETYMPRHLEKVDLPS
jgi:hypothetical protein